MRGKTHPLDKWLSAGLDLLFPIHCVGCGAGGAIWCPDCDAQLVRQTEPLCPDCGLGLGTLRGCPSCRHRRPSLPIRSYARYTGRLVSALLHLKYRPDQRLARRMGNWLVPIARQQAWAVSVVVPVPLAPGRRRQRGFNQARLLSEQVARSLGLPHRPGQLLRIDETRSQVGLTPLERWANVGAAFHAAPGSFAGDGILLIDDLTTTGATLSACAQALRAAGAGRVWGLTVGRA